MMVSTATKFSIPEVTEATKSPFPPAVDLVVDKSSSKGIKRSVLPTELGQIEVTETYQV